MIAALGCTLGIVPHILAAITGLAALLHTSALAFQVVKYLGVAYLLYMAWATWKDRGALTVDEESTPRSAVVVVGSDVRKWILSVRTVRVGLLRALITSCWPPVVWIVRDHAFGEHRLGCP